MPTKNRLSDLNDHLFAQMERLSDESLKGDALREEVGRAKVISSVATQIIANARLVLDAQETVINGLIKNPPAMLGVQGYVDGD